MRLAVRLVAMVAGIALTVGLAPATAVVLYPVEPVKPGAPTRDCGWPIVYPLTSNYAWPDTNASYIVQSVVLGPGEKVVLTGRDPRARYWSITTYNAYDRTVLDRVNDASVERKGRGKKAKWTVTVSREASPRDPNSLLAAGDYVPGEFGSNITVIMYRVYLPEKMGYRGGPLPKVTLKHGDGTTQKLEACRPSQIGPPLNPPEQPAMSGVPDYFVRGSGAGIYPSRDTAYVAAEVVYDPSRILVISGRAPTRKQVRYWSLCQNVNAPPLPVVDCASDADVVTRNGRYVIAVVGPGQVPDRSLFPGVTFVEWSNEATPDLPPAFLIMRHILPSPAFAGAIDKVKDGDAATTTMGEYAPIIEQIPLAELSTR
jgi:hypothetical protein